MVIYNGTLNCTRGFDIEGCYQQKHNSQFYKHNCVHTGNSFLFITFFKTNNVLTQVYQGMLTYKQSSSIFMLNQGMLTKFIHSTVMHFWTIQHYSKLIPQLQ